MQTLITILFGITVVGILGALIILVGYTIVGVAKEYLDRN